MVNKLTAEKLIRIGYIISLLTFGLVNLPA